MTAQTSFGTARGLLSAHGADLLRGDDGAVITSVETYALAVPLKRPIADSTAAMAHWTVPVVEIRTADGRVGTGISGVHCAPELLSDVEIAAAVAFVALDGTAMTGQTLLVDGGQIAQ